MIISETDDLKLLIKELERFPIELRQALEEINKERFATLKDVNNVPYKPNSEAWIKVKGNRTPTIGLTGDLRADLTVTREGDVIRMISNMDYASELQEEREFLGVSEGDLQRVLDSLIS